MREVKPNSMTSFKTSKRLFVTGLPYKFSEGQLLRMFVEFGRVIDARIILNKWGKSRGMGYVEFEEESQAVTAKKKMHNYHIDEDRHIIVDFAKIDPMLTPEGRARHEEAIRRKKTKRGKRKFNPDIHVRETVYEQRKFGSKVGKKFAKRSKKK